MNRKEAIKKAKEILEQSDNLTQELEEILRYFANTVISLADFLGWEEDVEYELMNNKFMILADNNLYELFNDKWYKCSFGINKYKELQQAKKVKKKAYHVKDEYSYNCLMKELEEQDYTWFPNTKPTDMSNWYVYKDDTVIYCYENKTLAFSDLWYFKHCDKDTYELIEYHKEEPKFYAKLKGWELLKKGDRYWNYDTEYDHFLPSNNGYCSGYTTMATKSEWNELGINDTNADFEEVEE